MVAFNKALSNIQTLIFWGGVRWGGFGWPVMIQNAKRW